MAALIKNVRSLANLTTLTLRSTVPRVAACALVHKNNETKRLFSNIRPSLTCTQIVTSETVVRPYSTDDAAKLKDIESRVLQVIKKYDKINAEKLTLDSHFMNDLGLDSLDQIEVIMAMEDEFGFEIPDADSERLMRPKDIIQYIADKDDLFD